MNTSPLSLTFTGVVPPDCDAEAGQDQRRAASEADAAGCDGITAGREADDTASELADAWHVKLRADKHVQYAIRRRFGG